MGDDLQERLQGATRKVYDTVILISDVPTQLMPPFYGAEPR